MPSYTLRACYHVIHNVSAWCAWRRGMTNDVGRLPTSGGLTRVMLPTPHAAQGSSAWNERDAPSRQSPASNDVGVPSVAPTAYTTPTPPWMPPRPPAAVESGTINPAWMSQASTSHTFSHADTKPTVRRTTSQPGPSRPVGRPPLLGKASGARRGRPPRQPRPPASEAAPVAPSFAAPVPGVVTRPPPAPSAAWTPSLSVPKQQAVLVRAMQASKAQNDAHFTPFHALLQLGYVFMRCAQMPVTPTASLGEGVVLRLDEASSLGVLPPQLATLASASRANVPPVAKAPAWPELPTFAPGQPFVLGGAPPSQSAVGMPITPSNTHVRKLKDWKPMAAKDEDDLRATMEKDAAYDQLRRRQDQAMEQELQARMKHLMRAQRPIPWWQRRVTESSPRTEPLQILYPAQKQRQHELRPKLQWSERLAAMPETLVPIRLDIEHDPYKLRDTFMWNAVEDEASLDLFAASICEDLGVPSQVFMELIKTAVQTQVNEFATTMALRMSSTSEHDDTRGRLTESDADAWRRLRSQEPDAVSTPTDTQACDAEDELRVLIKIDILVGATHLVDQFEWDIATADSLAAERFAEAFTADLGLAGEFKTAIAHSIREQVAAYLRWLAIVGYPYQSLEGVEDDIRPSFLPAIPPSQAARQRDMVDAFTPKLVQLNAVEVMHLEREHERDMRRKRRQTKGRRGAHNVDIEPQRTIRSIPLYGFQGAVPEAERPMHARRAAAAAAAHLSSAAQHDASPGPDELPAPAKRIRHDWYEMFFLYPRGREAPVHRAQPRLGQVPPAPAAPHRAPTEAPILRHVRPEDLERQQPIMHHGEWHCSNCGVPGSLMPARRKGPLGEKSLCGPCGKYFHRHRRVPSVTYSRDPAHHRQRRDAFEHEALLAEDGEYDAKLGDAQAGAPAGASPPAWLVHAVHACRAKYPMDRFHLHLHARSPAPSDDDVWRIKCTDCPGKVYKPGPAESLTNFEIHLKNRSHRAAVARRLEEAHVLDAPT